MSLELLTWQDLEPYFRKARNQSLRSCSKYKSCFKFLKIWFGDKEFDIKNFSNFLYELEKQGISPAHQNNYIKFVKHLAHYMGIYDSFSDFPLLEVPDSTPEYILTPQEIHKLATVRIHYKKYKNKVFKYKALIFFLGNIGSRLEETLSLRFCDIIPKPVPVVHFRKETTKTHRERFYPIPQWLCDMLLSLPREDALIFSKIDSANFRRDLDERTKLCKIPYKVKPSTFRDSSINNKLSYGMPIQEVGTYHGHVKIDTTFKYYTLIQAGQMAQTLRQFDPAYQKEVTFNSAIDGIKELVEKRINPKVFEFIFKQGKGEVWFGFKDVLLKA